jgi:hypothetical protein
MEQVNAGVKPAAAKVEQLNQQPFWDRDLILIIGIGAFIVASLLVALFNF